MRNSLEAVIKINSEADRLSEPVIGIADVNNSLIRNIREHTFSKHLMPEEILPSAKIIISYFLPFKKEYAATNISGVEPSETWVKLYSDTNKIIERVNMALVEKINELGYHADYFRGGFDEYYIMSRWSQRHIAEAAGLGKFGINNMLITKYGSCGRFGSVVSDIPLAADSPMTEELCIYKLNGGCMKCVKNCFANALTADEFNRKICYGQCSKNEKKFSADVCGKCAVDIPCAFKK